MIVHKRSWHYRLHSFVFTFFNWESYGPLPALKGRRWEHQPHSLCGYFWSTLALTMLAPLIALILLFALLIFIVPFGAYLGGEKVHHTYRQHRPKKASSKPDKEPGLVSAYVKARKQKICPIIKLVD